MPRFVSDNQAVFTLICLTNSNNPPLFTGPFSQHPHFLFFFFNSTVTPSTHKIPTATITPKNIDNPFFNSAPPSLSLPNYALVTATGFEIVVVTDTATDDDNGTGDRTTEVVGTIDAVTTGEIVVAITAGVLVALHPYASTVVVLVFTVVVKL